MPFNSFFYFCYLVKTALFANLFVSKDNSLDFESSSCWQSENPLLIPEISGLNKSVSILFGECVNGAAGLTCMLHVAPNVACGCRAVCPLAKP